MDKLDSICVIPAKARSTRLPGKNTVSLAGKPLIVWTIEAALRCELFDVVMVSTDDEAIAKIARQAGAEVPFQRNEALTGDKVEVPEVVRDALQWYQRERGQSFDWVCILQPTSPLRTADDVKAARRLLDAEPDADTVVSVSNYQHHPHWALRIDEGRVKPHVPEDATRSRQDLPELVHPDGAVYWRRSAAILSGKGVYDGIVLAYLTPPASAVDIDHPHDLEYAGWLLSRREADGREP